MSNCPVISRPLSYEALVAIGPMRGREELWIPPTFDVICARKLFLCGRPKEKKKREGARETGEVRELGGRTVLPFVHIRLDPNPR